MIFRMRMVKKMRERLINLIDSADEECKHTKDCKICSGYGKGSSCMNYHIADHLLENGVVVLPCKVGDEVYEIVHGEVSETEAVGFVVCQDGAILLITRHFFPLSREIGCSVFLTREDAEKALKERGVG